MPESTDSNSKSTQQEKATGVVVSTGGQSTCTVELSRLVRHRLYGKYMKRRTKLAVHDPDGKSSVGDTVEVVACRPISKRKSWRLLRVIAKSKMSR